VQHAGAKRVIVVGAGPIGLAAAMGAVDRGFDVTVLEAGDVGESLRRWGSTRFFTPLRMNFPGFDVGRVLDPSAEGGRCGGRGRVENPSHMDGDDLLTGPEFVEQVLVPAAARLNVRTHTRVVSISRRGMTRTDYAGHPLRAERPFRVLTGGDEVLEADVILDATGNTSLPLPYTVRGQIDAIRTLGELDVCKDELRGRRVLLVGNGHSAANAVAVLRDAGAEITWAVRTANRRPIEEMANDPLPERQRVASLANELASQVRCERRATVESIDVCSGGRSRPPAGARSGRRYTVTLTGNRCVEVDAVVALTGYRPASDYTSELALEISPVSEGGARLYRAISNIIDCLCVPQVAKEDFGTGEPGYFFIGARAYGRSRTFLLQTGLQQLRTILDSL
jgi:thioredoxin reductase